MQVAIESAGLAPWVIKGKAKPTEPGPEQELWDTRNADATMALAHNIGKNY